MADKREAFYNLTPEQNPALFIFLEKFFIYKQEFLKISRIREKVVKCGMKWEIVPKWGDNVFIGEFQHSLDNKGRLIIPSKFREGLGERFVLTKGLDNCLFVYPLSEWHNFEEKLKTLPLTSRDARAFVRFFFSGATECELDKQGRILLPANLREYSGIEKDAVVIGVSTRVEIWSLEEWNRYNSDTIMGYDKIAERMEQLGI